MTRYAATRLPCYQGPAAWSAILPAFQGFASLEQDAKVDIAIIGAGFAGLSAARRALEIDPKLRICILEANKIAEGVAGRNSGFMIDIPHELNSADYTGSESDLTMIALNRQAQDFARAAVQEYDIPSAFFDPAGKINAAASERAGRLNTALALELDRLGESYQLLDHSDMTRLTGSRHYHSGLYSPGTVMLQPAGYIQGLARGLARDGVAIYEHSPTIRFERSGDGWVMQTPKARIACDQVILTVNGHLESFGIAKGRLMHLMLFAAMTPDLNSDQLDVLGGESRWGLTPSDPMGTTVRRIDMPQGGNRIVTRSCAALRSNLSARSRDMRRAAQAMQRKFDQRFPQLAGMAMEYLWAGQLCLSMNGVGVTREIERGVFSGCVQNGLGTARGTLAGIAAAEAALGQTSNILRYFENQEHPSRLPPTCIRDVGANMVLRYREHRARAE